VFIQGDIALKLCHSVYIQTNIALKAIKLCVYTRRHCVKSYV